MENLEAGGEETCTLLNNNMSKISSPVGTGSNNSETNSEKLYHKEVSPCVDPAVQVAVGEAKKRLKKIQQEYDYATKRYRAVEGYHSFLSPGYHSLGYCIHHCVNLVKHLRYELDRMNIEEATQRGRGKPKHNKKFLMLHGCTSLAQEKRILGQKAENKKPNNEKLREEANCFENFTLEFHFMLKIIPRNSSGKYVDDLLSKLKETNNLREKAIVGSALVSNLKSQEYNIKKFTSSVIKLLTRMMEELKKEKGERDKVYPEKRRNIKRYINEMRHLQEKRESLCDEWDDERKYMLGLNNTPDDLLYFLPDFQLWIH